MSDQTAGEQTTPSNYCAFLLRLWRDDEHAAWRASLQAIDTPERLGFSDFEAVVVYLRAVLQCGDDPDEIEP